MHASKAKMQLHKKRWISSLLLCGDWEEFPLEFCQVLAVIHSFESRIANAMSAWSNYRHSDSIESNCQLSFFENDGEPSTKFDKSDSKKFTLSDPINTSDQWY